MTARSMEVVQLAVGGDELELSSVGGERTFAVDRQNVDAAQAPVELTRRGDGYAVRATRLDGDLWEVEADPL